MSSIDDDAHSPTNLVLSRNAACHQCRKRKLKCDAQKPVCGNCAKPRVRGSKPSISDSPQDPIECTWDRPKEPSARTKRRRELAKRQAMESDDKNVKNDQSGNAKGGKAKKTRLNEPEGRHGGFNGRFIDPGHFALDETAATSYLPGSSIRDGLARRPDLDDADYPRNGAEEYTYRHPPFSIGIMGDIPFYPEGSPRDGRAHEVQGDEGDSLRPWASLNGSNDSAVRLEPSDGSTRSFADLNGYTASVPNTTNGDLDEALSVFWPDWPKALPMPAVVDRAVRVFFDKVPTLPKMLNKSQLLQNISRSPSHPDFPSTSLLHSILAITANFISETSLSSPSYFPVGTPSQAHTHPTEDFHIFDHIANRSAQPQHPSSGLNKKLSPVTSMARFQLWHRRKAFETFYHYVDRGEKLVQCLQAQIIATTVDQYNAWWTDVWIETGSCVRVATPLRLHESPHVPDSSLQKFAHLLAPAKTAMDQAERDRTWWMTYLLERNVTASTSCPTALIDDEITVELPVLQSTFDAGYGELYGTQTLHSPDCLTHHPPEHRDSLCFLIKSIKLLSEVNVFFCKYSRGSHSLAGYVTNPTFRILLSQINSFRTSFPPEYRRPTQNISGGGANALDRDLIMALWVTHSAIMALGEPLITKDSWMDEGARVTLSAIRATLSLLYDVTSTSYDLSLFPPFASFVWSMTCRGLIRFMGTAMQSGDMVSAAVFRSEVEVFRLAMKRYGERFPVGNGHLKVVDDLLETTESKGEDPGHGTRFQCKRELIMKCGREVGASIIEELSSSNPTSTSMVTPEAVLSESSTSNARMSTAASASTSASGGVRARELPPVDDGATGESISALASSGSALAEFTEDGGTHGVGTTVGSFKQPRPVSSYTGSGPHPEHLRRIPSLTSFFPPSLAPDPNVSTPVPHGDTTSHNQPSPPIFDANTLWSAPPYLANLQSKSNMFSANSFMNGAGPNESSHINPTSPAFLSNNTLQDGTSWDISSFSFDVNNVAGMFEGSGATFDGQDYGFGTM
ncbi:hypothetical protein L198_05672 [Cryptococcus wingfieldii CBS 7118]|uniref:Zn(2)-C6 fungal-type domain-containing protein n=1 Tax=Cryptococcus wingfieldii CBS 7118 TaxID=1295528 RepID=A0A1E3ITQ9_9TREE|nr:hypothetical protein L198_05672 [Cryptococcus wingfieldii CBS 7118]ODN92000.1 hypothetical protein L198_05672 [Cryptococcus wingfieldii CBS 7118]